jgi:hypothetical protein
VTIREHVPAVKPESHSGVRRFTPDDPSPSSRSATRDLPPLLREAAPGRIRYRLRVTFADDEAPTGRREELIEFGDPRKCLDLMRRLGETPDRPVIASQAEVFVRPRWSVVRADYVLWRAAQRDRRDELRREMDRLAAERSARERGGAR